MSVLNIPKLQQTKMGTKGLSNSYLEKLGRQVLPKSFLGVYPSDIEPNVKRLRVFSIIFNTGRSFSKGEHFVAVFIRNKNIIYFDSFGEPLKNTHIIKF